MSGQDSHQDVDGGPDAAGGTGEPEGPGSPECSAKGCRQPAVWELLWNNPKLHRPERRKSWLACDDHRASLSDFLGARGFLRDVVPLGPTDGPGPAEG